MSFDVGQGIVFVGKSPNLSADAVIMQRFDKPQNMRISAGGDLLLLTRSVLRALVGFNPELWQPVPSALVAAATTGVEFVPGGDWDLNQGKRAEITVLTGQISGPGGIEITTALPPPYYLNFPIERLIHLKSNGNLVIGVDEGWTSPEPIQLVVGGWGNAEPSSVSILGKADEEAAVGVGGCVLTHSVVTVSGIGLPWQPRLDVVASGRLTIPYTYYETSGPPGPIAEGELRVFERPGGWQPHRLGVAVLKNNTLNWVYLFPD